MPPYQNSIPCIKYKLHWELIKKMYTPNSMLYNPCMHRTYSLTYDIYNSVVHVHIYPVQYIIPIQNGYHIQCMHIY